MFARKYNISTEPFWSHHASLASSTGWLCLSKEFSNCFTALFKNTRWAEVSSRKHSCTVFSHQTEVNSDRPCGKHQEFLFLFLTNYLSDLYIIFSPERLAGPQSKQTAPTVGRGQSVPSASLLVGVVVVLLSGLWHNRVCSFITCFQILYFLVTRRKENISSFCLLLGLFLSFSYFSTLTFECRAGVFQL